MSLRDFVNRRAPQTIRGIAIVKGIRCILFEFIDPRDSLHEHIHVLVGKLNSYFLGSVARGEAITFAIIYRKLSVNSGRNKPDNNTDSALCSRQDKRIDYSVEEDILR